MPFSRFGDPIDGDGVDKDVERASSERASYGSCAGETRFHTAVPVGRDTAGVEYPRQGRLPETPAKRLLPVWDSVLRAKSSDTRIPNTVTPRARLHPLFAQTNGDRGEVHGTLRMNSRQTTGPRMIGVARAGYPSRGVSRGWRNWFHGVPR
jgi:hypothetical protein